MKELVIAAPHSSNPAARARTARTWQGPARRAATRQQVCCQRSRRGGTDTKGGMKASSRSSVYTFTCFETEGPSDASEPSICCARFMKKLKVPPRCRNIQTGAITRVSRVLGVRPSSEPPGRCLDLRKPGFFGFGLGFRLLRGVAARRHKAIASSWSLQENHSGLDKVLRGTPEGVSASFRDFQARVVDSRCLLELPHLSFMSH